jgi:hypothetical protein
MTTSVKKQFRFIAKILLTLFSTGMLGFAAAVINSVYKEKEHNVMFHTEANIRITQCEKMIEKIDVYINKQDTTSRSIIESQYKILRLLENVKEIR